MSVPTGLEDVGSDDGAGVEAGAWSVIMMIRLYKVSVPTAINKAETCTLITHRDPRCGSAPK